MCAISGILGRTNLSDRSLVESMNLIQAHRGPDNDCIFESSGAVLGHRRLSIIDIDDRSSQPMLSNDRRYVIVFNGEIYNYLEIRSLLKNSYDFRTDSDTEVLLAAYTVWGKSCLQKFVGMFAFCIYDLETSEAFLARDPFGQKPVFFYENRGRLIFASEIKAILVAGVKAAPDFESWGRYLNSASYDDSNSTFFEGISQLMPGEYAIWNSIIGIRKQTYFSLPSVVGCNKPGFSEAVSKTRALLLESVKVHMRSDVPVGLSLSGGLDSATLLGCIQELRKLEDKDHTITCLSFEFEEDISEAVWINAAAKYHGLESDFVVYNRSDFLNDIKPLMWHLEAPIGGLANCAMAKLMSRAKQLGLKVMQDGTGLDEAFAGYRNHHDLYLDRKLKEHGPMARKYIAEYATFWEIPYQEALAAVNNQRVSGITSIDGTSPLKRDLIKDDFKKRYSGEIHKSYKTGSEVYDELIDYLHRRKIPRNTRMKDRTSMAYSVELRLPFLENNLIEYALGVPEDYHFLYGRTKSIIREAMAGSIQEGVRTASKRSIQAPQGKWLKESHMRDYVTDLINSESFSDRGIFDIEKVRMSYDNFCAGNYDNSFFVWQWVNVEEWFRIFIDRDSTTETLQLTKY